MARFNPGDRVVANKSIVATLLTYDEATGRLVLEQDLGGGATNLIYGPISSYDLELLVSEAVTAQPEQDEAPAEEAPVEAPKDEFTTLDVLS